MKKIILTTLIGLATLASCTSNVGQNDEERRSDFAEMIDVPTTIEFDEMNFDFGTITDGDLVSNVFTFKNTGDKDLVLIAVKASCGCTVPEDWPKHPIAPGESGEIKVTFNSANKLGNIRKTIRIEANTSPTVTTLAITGVVEAVK
jgi:hypothetical protein